MDNIAGIPYTTAEFDADGATLKAPALPGNTAEIIVVSHGWNNNRDEAQTLYRTLFENVAKASQDLPRQRAIIGIIWPSKTFDFSAPAQENAGQVMAAAAGGPTAAAEQQAMERAYQEFARVLAASGKDAGLAALHALLPDLAQPAKQRAFVEQLRVLVAPPASDHDFDASSFFAGAGDARDVFLNARQASAEVGEVSGADEIGGDVTVQGLGDVFSGLSNAVGALLNIGTYYEMKKRAGTVGTLGVAPLLDLLGGQDNVKAIHLVGHSFGARLVTAAAMQSTTPKLFSLSLLQGAFSHNGFAPQGYFRQVIESKRVAGPIVITHTQNDKAVGKAYAIASRIAQDSTKGVGDADDIYGGMGSNGAVRMQHGEVAQGVGTLLPVQGAYQLANGLVHNLESSAFISGHSDVAGPQVAWLLSRVFAQAGAGAT